LEEVVEHSQDHRSSKSSSSIYSRRPTFNLGLHRDEHEESTPGSSDKNPRPKTIFERQSTGMKKFISDNDKKKKGTEEANPKQAN
jgi:hypothetical protein